jgi:hypothetical protein
VFTALVVVGILMELWVIWDEHSEDMETWAETFFGIHRTLRPPTRRLVVEYFSVVLVAGGIIGELGISIKIASVNGQLRGVDAQLRSKNAELRAASDRLVALLNQEVEAEHSARVKIEGRVAWRRLSREQQSVIADHLKQFPVMRVGITFLAGNDEAAQFADDIAAASHGAGWNRYKLEPFNIFGGFGGGVYPLHPSTGVNVSTTGEKGRGASEAIQHDLCSMGFDTAITPKPPPGGPNPNIDVEVLVVARPMAPQGTTKLAINAKKKACTGSE